MRLEYTSAADVAVKDVLELGDRAADLVDVLEDIGERMVEFSIPENFRQGGRPNRWPGSAWSHADLMQDSSRLLNSVVYSVEGGRLVVGTNAAYAAQRHFGGEIKPTKAKALAVPLPGIPSSMRRPRHWGDRLQFAPTQKGDSDSRGILGEADGDLFIPRFALRARVEQPPRPFLLFQDDDIAYAERIVAAFVLAEDPTP